MEVEFFNGFNKLSNCNLKKKLQSEKIAQYSILCFGQLPLMIKLVQCTIDLPVMGMPLIITNINSVTGVVGQHTSAYAWIRRFKNKVQPPRSPLDVLL